MSDTYICQTWQISSTPRDCSCSSSSSLERDRYSHDPSWRLRAVHL